MSAENQNAILQLMDQRLKYAMLVRGLKAWQVLCMQCLHDSDAAILEAIVDLGALTDTAPVPGHSQQVARVPHGIRTHRAQSLQSVDVGVLDFILDLTGGNATDGLIDEPRYGVWFFNHSDGFEFCSAEPYFWEIYHDYAVSGAMLLRRVKNDEYLGTVLKSGYFPTMRASRAEDVDNCFLKSAVWPAQVCSELARGVAPYLEGRILPKPSVSYGIPTALERLRCRVKMLRNRVTRFSQKYERPYWNIAMLPVTHLNRVARADISLLAPDDSGEFLADPFAFEKDGRMYVFCEQYRYANDHGRIAVLEIGANRGVEPAIDEPFHMSYPQVFELSNRIYCIPESCSANQVRLYEAGKFPTEWKLQRTLLNDFPAVDPTVFRYDSRWWMFCTKGGDGSCTDLYIWYADDLFGPWTAHPRNPVKSDVRSARPAGKPFERNGVFYRPAQDCSRTYGGKVVINRIVTLTTKDFEESIESIVTAPSHGPYRRGVHTISLCGDRLVIDVKRYRFSWQGVAVDVKASARGMLRKAGLSETQIERLKSYLKRVAQAGR